MIRCEHCGSTLPDGAIFCGECGRSVNVSANRRPAPAAPVDDTPPPPLRQPDRSGRLPDPAAEAWLPEATLDPATRAWLTGEDRQRNRTGSVPIDRPAAPAPAPLQAPEHVNAAAPGLTDWADVGRPDVVRGAAPRDRADGTGEPEPPLDPDAYPSTADAPGAGDDPDDPEHTRVAPPRDRPADGATRSEAAPTADAPTGRGAAPAWAPPAPQQPVAPSRPSWWVGRGAAAAEPPLADESQDPATPDQQPRPGDTAVVEPLVDRRPAPTPLIAPGNGPATCPVCGHALEPDDIFCAECGAVRPTVTAAFTGPVVPLPMARPDWAADDELPSDELPSDASSDGGVRDDEQPGGEQPDDEQPDDEQPDEDAHDQGRARSGAGADEPSTAVSTAPAPAPARHAAAADGSTTGDTGTVSEDTPRTPVRPRGAHAVADQVSDSGAVGVPGDGSTGAPGRTPVWGATAPASPTVPSSAPRTGSDEPAVPRAAPLPPVPGSTGPVLPAVGSAPVPSSGDAEFDDEDVEETRIVAKTASSAPFVLHFSTGERTAVHGTGLLGRLPRPQPGERFDDLLTVHDPGKSVSKTHLELGRDGDDLWVSDRFSGNGTVVRHIDGSIRRCEPGRRYRVERGARVDIGEQFFLVQ